MIYTDEQIEAMTTEEKTKMCRDKIKEKYPELSPEMRDNILKDYYWWYKAGIDEGAKQALEDYLPKILEEALGATNIKVKAFKN
jgi:hypothetical protein